MNCGCMYYGKKVILRSLELSDVDEIMKYINSLELRKTLGGIVPLTNEQEIDFVKKSWENRMKGESYVFALTTLDGKFLGSVALEDVDTLGRTAELGILIGDPQNQNQGYGTDAVIAICAFGFQYLNLHSIYLRHVEYNDMGVRAYEKAGFTKTGIEREVIFRDGKYFNAHRMDILDREFFEKFPDYSLYPAK